MKNFTIGSDPECFIIDESKNNKIISSVGIIPGEKGNAYKPEGLQDGFGLEPDNILAEFNIPPTKLEDEEAFVGNMLKMKEWLVGFLKNINPNYNITSLASSLIDEDQLQTPEAQEIGCAPDYCVYTNKVNKKPSKFEDNRRTTGRVNALA